MRLGSLADGPFRIGPVIRAIEMIAYSSKGEPLEIPVEIIDDVREFSLVLYEYMAIVTLLLSMILGGTFVVFTNGHSEVGHDCIKFILRSLQAL